jgi:hypothetical protein
MVVSNGKGLHLVKLETAALQDSDRARWVHTVEVPAAASRLAEVVEECTYDYRLLGDVVAARALHNLVYLKHMFNKATLVFVMCVAACSGEAAILDVFYYGVYAWSVDTLNKVNDTFHMAKCFQG